MGTARDAGFASVTTVGAQFVNGMLSGAAALVPPVPFSLPSIVNLGGNAIGISGSLRLNAPVVSFAANPDNLIGVAVSATGTLQLTSNGTDLVEVDVTFASTLQVGLFANVSPASLVVGINVSQANVTSAKVTVTFGPPLATEYKNALNSAQVLAALTAALRAVPQSALSFTVPGVSGTLSYTFSGVTVKLPVSKVTLIPLDGNVGIYPTPVGCLNIALDVAPYTSGNPSQLVNLITTVGPTGAGYSVGQYGSVTFSGDGANNHNFGANVATLVNVGFFSTFVNTVIAPQLNGVTVQGVTIESANVSFGSVTAALNSGLPTCQFNCLTANVKGSYKSIGFNFSGSFTPVEVEIEQPYRLSYSMWLVNYDYSSPFLTIVNILLPIVMPWLGVLCDLIIDSTVDSLIANAIGDVPGFGMNGTGSLPFPGLSGWELNYWVDDVAVSTSEITGYMAITVVQPPATPPPPVFTLIGSPHALTDSNPIPVTLLISNSGLLNPLLGLRITWTAVRDDTGATTLNHDKALTTSALAIAIDRWRGDLIYNNTWTVTCTVYRPGDALTGRYNYFSQTISVGVSDLVDRHHPYVSWQHTAFFHDPSGLGTLKQHPFWTRNRKSRIHRTDILIRCEAIEAAFAIGYLQETGHGLIEPKINAPSPEYIDSIAQYGSFDDVEQWRHGILCDYCFFGGPTRTEWKKPTHPTPPFE